MPLCALPDFKNSKSRPAERFYPYKAHGLMIMSGKCPGDNLFYSGGPLFGEVGITHFHQE